MEDRAPRHRALVAGGEQGQGVRRRVRRGREDARAVLRGPRDRQDRSGRRSAVVADLEQKHGENSWASSTPAADGERVYVTFLDKPQMRVYCYDFAGN